MSTTAWFNLESFKDKKPAGKTLHYDLCSDALVTLEIYDMLGRRVRTLVQGEVQHPGHYDVYWDSLDGQGKPVHPGCYLYELLADAPEKQAGR